MMNVPLALRNSQNELRAAIHKHQIFLKKLKDSPSDEDLQRKLEMIQKHIMSLGLVQKKLVQKFRKDIENSKTKSAEKKNELKLSSATENVKQPKVNGGENRKLSTENIAVSATSALSVKTERSVSDTESAATGDTPSTLTSSAITPCTPVKTATSATTPSHSAKRSPSLSPPAYCAITDRINKNRLIQSQGRIRKGSSSPSGSEASHDSTSEIKPYDAELNSKLEFMTALGLVTRKVLCELQNRRVERKKRSTANPQFVYGNRMEQAVKRKKQGSSGIQNGEAQVVTIARLVAVPNSTCLVCSSGKGALSVCWSCRRAFHWNCVSDSPMPPSSEGQLHCSSCRTSSNNTHTNMESPHCSLKHLKLLTKIELQHQRTGGEIRRRRVY